jgi:hypothetical protein
LYRSAISHFSRKAVRKKTTWRPNRIIAATCRLIDNCFWIQIRALTNTRRRLRGIEEQSNLDKQQTLYVRIFSPARVSALVDFPSSSFGSPDPKGIGQIEMGIFFLPHLIAAAFISPSLIYFSTKAQADF